MKLLPVLVGALLVSTAVHYTDNFAAWQWTSVLADGITGLAVLGFALWSAARLRPGGAARRLSLR